MNSFQSQKSGEPELKDFYDSGNDTIFETLKRRRKKLAEDRGITNQQIDEADEDETT